MGLLDFASGAMEFVGFDDIVGDLFKTFDTSFLGGAGAAVMPSWAGDLLTGAITNSAVTAIAGGDIGKAALFGAAGGFAGDNMMGAAIKGYGLADANDGDGLIGAAAGAAGQYASDNWNARSGGGGSTGTTNASRNVAQNGAIAPPVPATTSTTTANPATVTGSISDKLMQLGLVNSAGEGTLLGKALVTGAGAAASVRSAEDIAEQSQKDALERDTHQMNLDHQLEQKRIASFASPQKYQIVR